MQLIKHFPLVETRMINIHGINIFCLVRTEEHEDILEWNGGQTVMGWEAVGDYKYMHTAEDFYLPRDLVSDNEVEPYAGDALIGILPAYLDNTYWIDKRFNYVYHVWRAKTEEEPYHIYLLAVAALIEARLERKAFTSGDITQGQFQQAVDIANQYLDEPIDMPDVCDLNLRRSLRSI